MAIVLALNEKPCNSPYRRAIERSKVCKHEEGLERSMYAY